jgi:hypothetical protein
VHVGAAERLVVGFLAGGHLDQRRAAEEHLGLAVDQDGVVAHAGHVGAAGRGVAEHEGDRRDAHPRQLGQVVEDLAREHEQLGLRGQVGPARLDQVDHRQPVAPGDLEGAQRLAQRVGVHGPAAHGGIVGDEDALDPGHHADAGDDAGADGELGSPGGERRQLEQRRVPVDEELDPLAGQQPSPVVMARGVAGAAARPGDFQLLVQRGDGRQLAPPAGLVAGAAGVERGSKDGHSSPFRRRQQGCSAIVIRRSLASIIHTRVFTARCRSLVTLPGALPPPGTRA